MGILVSMVNGSGFRAECDHYDGDDTKSPSVLRGSVILSISTNDGNVTIHLTPKNALALETVIGQCLRDRDAVIAARLAQDALVEIADADDVDKSIRDGMTDNDRKAMNDLGGSVGY